jgi:hypothetical protein
MADRIRLMATPFSTWLKRMVVGSHRDVGTDNHPLVAARSRRLGRLRASIARLRLLHRKSHYGSVAIAFVAFLTLALLLSAGARAFLAPARIAVLTEKLEFLEGNLERYSIVFLGSSRIYRKVVPEVVDEAMRAAGCEERSFNLGVPGMTGVERDYTLDRLLEMQRHTLDWIVLEDVLPSISFDDNLNVISDRVRRFYQLQYLPRFIEDILTYPSRTQKQNVIETGKRLAYLAWGYTYEYSGLGKLSEIAMPETVSEAHTTYNEGFLQHRGYMPIDDETDAQFDLRRKVFLAGVEDWSVRERQMAERDRLWPNADERGRYLAERVARVAETGINAAFLILPQERPRATMNRISAQIKDRVANVQIMDYNNIDKYPQFYNDQIWFDAYHFTDEGAREFSALLGSDLCAMIKQKNNNYAAR